jgi:chemotaxis protein MotB
MKRVLLVIGLVAVSACVSKGRFKKVSSQLEATRAERDSLATALAAEKQKVVELDGEIKTLTARAEKAEVELSTVVADKAQLEASAAELKTALGDARKRKAEAEKRVAEFRDLLSKFKTLIDAGKLQVKIVDGRMVLALPTDVLFASGKATLNPEGEQAVREIAAVLATIKGRRFQVEGHTDNVPIKSRRYPSNWELAAERSMVVLRTMVAAGMPGEALSAASYGEFRPATSNDTPEGREANRRIEIVVVPDLSSLPGFDELQGAVGES